MLCRSSCFLVRSSVDSAWARVHLQTVRRVMLRFDSLSVGQTNNKSLYLLPNCLLLAVVLTGKVAVPEYWSRLKLDLLLRLFALNMLRM